MGSKMSSDSPVVNKKKRKALDDESTTSDKKEKKEKKTKKKEKKEKKEKKKAKKAKKETAENETDETEDKNEKKEETTNPAAENGGEEKEGESKTAPTPKVLDPAIMYLEQWSTKRSEWKFKKVRQIWLLKSIYDHKKVSAAHFALLLDYLEDLKGISRDKTLEEARGISDQFDADAKAGTWTEPAEHKLKKRKYKRAIKICETLS